ncbi:MAG: diguanylate cyclase [Magnetococcales bacterium]|nr:diguanylate cyclase [Magnetococcales bacterium]
MSIDHKLALGFGSLVGLVLLLAMLAWQNMQILDTLGQNHTRLQTMRISLLEARRCEKNYLLRFERRWVDLCLEKTDDLTRMIAAEARLNIPSEADHWRQAARSIAEYKERIDQTVQNGGPDLLQRVAIGERLVPPAARPLHEALEKLIMIRAKTKKEHMDWTEHFYSYYVIFTITMTIIVFTLIAYSIRSSLLAGVRFVKEIEAGNLQARIPWIPPDNIGILFNAMHNMAAQLRRLEDANIHAMASRLALSALLETSQEPLPLPRQLEIALQIILTVPFLRVQKKGAIFLVDDHTGCLNMVAWHGLHPDIIQSCREVAPGHCLCGRALEGKTLLYSSRVDEHHDTVFPGMEDHGHYCLPILARGSVQALLTLYLSPDYQHSPEDEALLTNVAFTLAGILERRRLEEKMRHMAHHDLLTSLPNRALFTEHLTLSLAKAARRNNLLALMIIDLDHFKQVNDTWGHAVGDQVLITTTKRIRACLRASDLIARLGGDEFAVILSDLADRGSASLVAEKIVHEVCQPMIDTSAPVTIGASVGIAIYPEHALDGDELMIRADKAMYEVKQQGRNGYRFVNTPIP